MVRVACRDHFKLLSTATEALEDMLKGVEVELYRHCNIPSACTKAARRDLPTRWPEVSLSLLLQRVLPV